MEESNIVTLIVVSILVILFLIISLVLFFNFSQKKILLEKERNHQQKMSFQKEMLESTIVTQEEERSRIARELHDDISSKLNVINMNMNILKMKVQEQDSKKILSEISASLNQSIERSRKISHELMPPILERFGLEEAISDLAQQINFSGALKMEISEKENFNKIHGQKKLHTFRIIQELCNNTLKHAEAKHISLSTKVENEILSIIYQDDGVGIPSDKISKGLGTMNIESRLQILDATWSQVPSEKGVKFKIKVPYELQTDIS